MLVLLNLKKITDTTAKTKNELHTKNNQTPHHNNVTATLTPKNSHPKNLGLLGIYLGKNLGTESIYLHFTTVLAAFTCGI